MAYTVDPNIPPRNVEMERRRRIYKNLKIEDTLKAEGVKSYDMLPFEKIRPLLSYGEKYDLYSKTSYLPLELFDDEEYDCRTAEEWINLGIINGVRYPLPATVFIERIINKKWLFDRNDNTLNNLFGWFHAAVMDYDNERNVWTVLTLDGFKRKFLLPRIYILFFGEDPRKFAKRIAAAIKQRQIAETSIRYHFYLDCMLVEDMPTLDESQQKVIILSATREGFLKCESKHLSNLMDEIILEYRRVMCDLMWRSLIRRQPETFNFIMWNGIDDIHELKTPEMGKLCTEMKDFAVTKNIFYRIILYVLPEVYEAMGCVVVECINISNMNLFVSNYGKSMHLSEFESQQQQETSTVIKYLKETWLERITQSIRLCLRDVGKGWFDLGQKNHDIYDVMKLKRFMDLIVHRMQEIIIAILDNSLSQCHQIRQVHPFLLPFLKFPKDLYLSSVGLLENQVCEVRERLRIAYQKSIISLKAYASEYQQYLGIYKLDVEKYVEDFKKADHTAAEVRDEVSFHFKMKSILELALPKDIVIGPFNVNVRPLREFLIQKRQNCCTQLLIMFTESFRTKIDIVLSDYVQIRTRLRVTLRNIEHLFEERDWMEIIPLTVKNLNEIVQKLKYEYDILDHFWWNLSDQDFEAKWQAIGFPRQVQLSMEEATNRFASEYEKFHKVQVQEEILLSERIDTLVGNVTNVTLQTDINKVHEMAVEVKRIWKIMKDYQESGLLLNERQKLFGMDVIPFEQLNQLMKDFEPYQTLWITASDWLKWQEIWLENPLISLDASQIERVTTDIHNAMSHCVKVFQENPKMAAIAFTIRDQIEAFKPYVGIIQALRNPGMKNRHFEELTKETGIPMALTSTLNFKNLLVLDVLKHEETIKAVADTAAKEFLIESTLDKMMTDWKTITMDVFLYKNTNKYIIKISDEVITLLDDDMLKTQHLSFSPFKAAFESQIDEWEAKLRLIQEVIAQWMKVQK
ncbi:dynein axonemal heavy chain 1-like [Temnothorax nylanderi]|uniref:dynein axonemal heavy chain 1-like n=1 Tax=Temnothorax nylanderi TaxID=102681 RepID=UPI003A88F94C